ncbi:YadA-like family protein [Fusobacterium russii]|uniref:YadA-like family protein n=1 Tax=Fusobacterium russii TaxID=854 RepID=UPI0003A9B22F|nr:YadA-like family protein [Fusobacterium russii]
MKNSLKFLTLTLLILLAQSSLAAKYQAGAGSTAHSDQSVAVGESYFEGGVEYKNEAGNPAEPTEKYYASAIGVGNKANGRESSAVGADNIASVAVSSAFGFKNRAMKARSSAFGYWNVASGRGSTAVGYENKASGGESITFGYTNEASGQTSTAVGNRNIASGDFSSAFGYKNTASGYESTAFGTYNLASGGSSSAFGYKNTASGHESTAFGTYNLASGGSSSAFGFGNAASKTGSSAFGTGNEASGYASSGFGYGNTASGVRSSAFGNENEVSGKKSTAVGFGNKVSGNNSGAFGDPNIVTGHRSYAFGNDNKIAGDDNFVMGSNVKIAAGITNSVALGNNSAVTSSNEVSVGSATLKRKITNVADGELSATSTDAVTGRQLYNAMQNNVGIENLKADVNERFTEVNKRFADVKSEINHVGSLSAALSALKPIQYDPQAPNQIMAGFGHYRNKQSIAVGMSHYFGENVLMTAGLAIGSERRVKTMANVGLTWKLGKGGSSSATNTPAYIMQDEMSRLTRENNQLKAQVNSQALELKEIKEQLKLLLEKK